MCELAWGEPGTFLKKRRVRRKHPLYPCCEWPEIMETELNGTFYTELPAFRWPKRTWKPGKGAKEKRALRRAAGNGTINEEM